MDTNQENKIWILHACNRLSIGGVQAFLMNYYKNINHKDVQFAFCVQRDSELPYDQKILDLGGRIHMIPGMREHPFLYAKALKSILREHPEYRIIHAHMNQRNAVALIIAKLSGVPIRISHAHNTGAGLKLIDRLRFIFLQLILGLVATDFWACSNLAATYQYNKWTRKKKKIRIIPNAIDAAMYIYNEDKRGEMRKSLGLREEFVLGHVGNYSFQKNYSFLFKIFQKLLEKKPNSRLMLVGDGEQREFVLDKARKIGIEDYLLILGRRNDVPLLMQAMDVFCFPSNFEGLGIVAIEAQAAGLPTFVSKDVPSDINITDLVIQLGIENENDLEQWQEAICQTMSYNRKNRYKEIVASGYDIQSSAIELQQEYKRMYKRKKGANL